MFESVRMNDSFLEELELGPLEQRTGNEINHAEKYITTRRQHESVTAELCADKVELESLIKEQQKQNKLSSSSTVLLKTSGKKLDDNSPSKDMYSKRKVDIKDKIQLETKKLSRDKNPNKLQTVERKSKVTEDKLKLVENIDRSECIKSNSSSNDGKKRTNPREKSRLSDGSSKENNRPSESSIEVGVTHSEVTKEWRQISNDGLKKKSEINEDNCESVAMLNAIKKIVSGYTKLESSKIMKMMSDHYINSQANLIKQLLIMSDDLQQSHPSKDSLRIQTLINENARLVDNVAFLKNRIDELQKNIEATDKIRQENTALKLKIRELEK